MRKAVVVSLSGIALLMGCSAPDNAQPPARLAPPIVGDPVNVVALEKTPCKLSGGDQIAQFHITAPGVVSPFRGGLACTWTPSPPALTYQAAADVTSGGIEALYQNRAAQPVFEPTTIQGYPAVHTGDDPRAAQQGRCTVQVGVADNALLVVNVNITDRADPNYTSPCVDADQFAGYAVGYLAAKEP